MANRTVITNAKEAYTLLDQSWIWQPDLSRKDPVQAPIFVSLEIDANRQSICQLGLSVFDPCWLASRNHDRKISSRGPIMTGLYLGTAIQRAKHEKQVFIVGKGRRLCHSALRQQLMRIFAPIDSEGRPRNVVLVGHNIIRHIQAIKRILELDVCSLPTVKAVFNTQILAKHTFKSTEPRTLLAILNKLDLRHGPINHAGHTSRYALRTLFASYNQLRRAKTELMEVIEQLSIIGEIAKFNEPRESLIWNAGERRYEIWDAVKL